MWFNIGPGSFLEVTKLLPLLIQGGSDSPSFHVIAPSLPNFGFSEGVKKVRAFLFTVYGSLSSSQKGFGIEQYAQAMNAVMLALGYEEYGTNHIFRFS